VRDGGPVVGVAGEVGLDQIEGLAPGAAGERAQPLDVGLDQNLVGVEVHDQSPVAASNETLRASERSRSIPARSLGAERAGDLNGLVDRAGVDDE